MSELRIFATGRRLMRAVVVVAFAMGVLTQESVAQGDARVVYVDSQRIFMQYTAYQEAQRVYQAEYDGWTEQLRQREEELVRLQSDFRAQQPMLSEERRLEKEMELQRKTREFEEYRQSIFGLGGLAVVRNQELLEPINAAVSKAIATIAEEEEYDLVLDAQDGNIIYGNDKFDITERVLEELQGTQPERSGEGEGPPTDNN